MVVFPSLSAPGRPGPSVIRIGDHRRAVGAQRRRDRRVVAGLRREYERRWEQLGGAPAELVAR